MAERGRRVLDARGRRVRVREVVLAVGERAELGRQCRDAVGLRAPRLGLVVRRKAVHVDVGAELAQAPGERVADAGAAADTGYERAAAGERPARGCSSRACGGRAQSPSSRAYVRR